MKTATLISRILVGSLFIVSGLIKANDPLGFSYKMEEYFSADVLNMAFIIPYSLAFAMFICIGEIVLGAATLFGAKMKLASWSMLLLIVFFTFLTFYSAYFNKVTDCGCFGDALKLTPWQSFWKDVILLILVLIIFIRRKKIVLNNRREDIIIFLPSLVLLAVFSFAIFDWGEPLYFSIGLFAILFIFKEYVKNKSGEWLMAVVAVVLSAYFTMYCYQHLPIRDYRPYAVGKSISEQMHIPEGAQPDVYETVLTYKNKQTGEFKDFNVKDKEWQDDSKWEWVNTDNKLISKGYEPPIHDFNLFAPDGNDYTEDILSEPVVFLIISYDITGADEAVQPDVNKFMEAAQDAGYFCIGVTASLYDDLEDFRHKHQSAYDYYSADAIMLKTIIRSNPGLLLLKQGTIAGKWHYNDFPKFDDLKSAHL